MFAIEFKDGSVKGRSTVTAVVNMHGTDLEGPITDAAVMALCVKRLCDSGALYRMAKDVCADVIEARLDAA